MLGELEALDSDIECGGVSGPGELPPPLHHLYGVGHLLSPGRHTEELQPQSAVSVQNSIGSYKLGGEQEAQ